MNKKVQLRRQRPEFKMVKAQNLVDHLMNLDELVLNMGAIEDPITKDEALVILLGSLTEEYQHIARIIFEKNKNIIYFLLK